MKEYKKVTGTEAIKRIAVIFDTLELFSEDEDMNKTSDGDSLASVAKIRIACAKYPERLREILEILDEVETGAYEELTIFEMIKRIKSPDVVEKLKDIMSLFQSRGTEDTEKSSG